MTSYKKASRKRRRTRTKLLLQVSHWFSKDSGSRGDGKRERVMKDLSDAGAALEDQHCCTCNPIPPLFFYTLIPLFFLGLSVSVFILIAVHNALFFVSFLVLSALVLAFIVWNTLQWKSNGAILFFLRSLPQSDLRLAREGQLVKITGVPTISLFLSLNSFLLMGSL